MMRERSPWDGIAVPSADLNVRQVACKTAVPCFWGRGTDGACLFVIELHGDHAQLWRKNAITVNGIGVDLRDSGASRQSLVISLDREVDRDLFEGLCRTLATALENASDSASSLAVAFAHIRRWKAFMSGRSQHLSPEEVRGLFAELVFFLELSSRQDAPLKPVDAWLGPERAHQDFIFGNTAVEIKSLSGAERSVVRISSEDQLESLNDALFLRIYRLSSLPDAAGARSLNTIVAEAQASMGDADAVEEFQRKLAAHGYAPLPDYDQPAFIVSETATYRVSETFPCLIRSQLPTGTVNVSYDLRLEAISAFRCNDDAAFGGN